MVRAMLKRGLLTLLCLVLALPAAGSDSRRIMLSAEAQNAWGAVGRLNVSGQGYCTATLVAPDLVLTAAHCIANRRTGQMVRPEQVHFLAGFRKGDFAIHGRAASIRPAARYFGTDRQVARDAALVQLRAPVPSDLVSPIPLADRTYVGQEVATYSYGRDRSFILSAEASCHILGRDVTLLGTSCEATPGVSGAPLVAQSPDGPRVAGVVVAMVGGKPPLMRGRALSVAVDPDARDRLFGGGPAFGQAAPIPRPQPRTPHGAGP